ncbi:MAG TPA: hypothetical protein VK116_06970 [Planctomycetota bacterium]|nr:hypothetical protein [Planctomycetota bacterium]
MRRWRSIERPSIRAFVLIAGSLAVLPGCLTRAMWEDFDWVRHEPVEISSEETGESDVVYRRDVQWGAGLARVVATPFAIVLDALALVPVIAFDVWGEDPVGNTARWVSDSDSDDDDATSTRSRSDARSSELFHSGGGRELRSSSSDARPSDGGSGVR